MPVQLSDVGGLPRIKRRKQDWLALVPTHAPQDIEPEEAVRQTRRLVKDDIATSQAGGRQRKPVDVESEIFTVQLEERRPSRTFPRSWCARHQIDGIVHGRSPPYDLTFRAGSSQFTSPASAWFNLQRSPRRHVHADRICR